MAAGYSLCIRLKQYVSMAVLCSCSGVGLIRCLIFRFQQITLDCWHVSSDELFIGSGIFHENIAQYIIFHHMKFSLRTSLGIGGSSIGIFSVEIGEFASQSVHCPNFLWKTLVIIFYQTKPLYFAEWLFLLQENGG